MLVVQLGKFTKNKWIIHLKWVSYMTYKCLYKFVKKITAHQDALTVLIYGHQEHSVRYSTCLIIFYLFVNMSVSFLCLGSSHVVAILSICLNDRHSYRYSRNSMSVELKCAPEKDRNNSHFRNTTEDSGNKSFLRALHLPNRRSELTGHWLVPPTLRQAYSYRLQEETRKAKTRRFRSHRKEQC